MSNKVFNLVRERYPDGGSKYNLLLAMATRADDKGGSIYESVETLAMNCRTDPRQIQRTLRKLEEEGVIEAVSSKKGGRQTTRYRIRLYILYAFPLYADVQQAQKAGISLDEYLQQKYRGGENTAPHATEHGDLSIPGAAKTPPETLTTDINKKNNNAREDLFDAEQKEKKPRKRFSYEREMPLPDDFCVTAELYEWAGKRGYQNIDRHLDNFIAHHGAKGNKFKDWQFAYQKWVIKDAEFTANRQATQQQRQTYKSRKEQEKEAFDAVRAEIYRNAKQPIGQPQPERDTNTRDIFDAEWTLIDDAGEAEGCPF